jgi:hypothetical protein
MTFLFGDGGDDGDGYDDDTPNRIEPKFWKFHAENPLIYEYFCRFTMEAIRAGHEKLSADMIMHRVRWETSVVTREDHRFDGQHFRISNDYVSYYARLWIRDHPEWPNFFMLRTLLNGEVSERLRSDA